jgi:hypothetical protein
MKTGVCKRPYFAVRDLHAKALSVIMQTENGNAVPNTAAVVHRAHLARPSTIWSKYAGSAEVTYLSPIPPCDSSCHKRCCGEQQKVETNYKNGKCQVAEPCSCQLGRSQPPKQSCTEHACVKNMAPPGHIVFPPTPKLLGPLQNSLGTPSNTQEV